MSRRGGCAEPSDANFVERRERGRDGEPNIYRPHKPVVRPAAATEASPQLLDLIKRVRAISVFDEDLARLMTELKPYLPPEPDTATLDQVSPLA